MINASQELLDELVCVAKVKCASIEFYKSYGEKIQIILKANYSEEDFNDFFNSLDFEYHDGYGTQYLYGIVWLEDGTWLSRDEYDGAEWWSHNRLPDIQKECL